MSRRQGRAVILTALGLEYDPIRGRLTDLKLHVHRSGTRFELGQLTDAGWEVVLAEIGEGNQAAATLTGQAIDTFNPDLVMFVGGAPSAAGWWWRSGWRWQAPPSSVAGCCAAPGPTTAGRVALVAAHDRHLVQALTRTKPPSGEP